MLRTIEVKNFQSINHAKVELGQFTVFTGPSSSGKSALLRAVHAVTRNNFVPSQVSQWASESKMSLEFDDCSVSADRGKSKSTYYLDDTEFPKAGRSVPDKVAAALSMPEIAETESTFATQFDKPYLIADPGSVAAKVLGSLTNVSVLHSGMRESNRRSLEAKNLIKVKNTDLTKVVESLEEIGDLAPRRTTINKALKDVQEVQASTDRLTALDTSISALANVKAELDDPSKRDHIDRLLSIIDDTTAYVSEMDEGLDRLRSLSSSLDAIVTSVNALNDIAPEPEWVDSADIPSDATVYSLKTLCDTIERVLQLQSDYIRNSDQLTKLEDETGKLEQSYHNILSDIDVCPLCGSELNGVHE